MLDAMTESCIRPSLWLWGDFFVLCASVNPFVNPFDLALLCSSGDDVPHWLEKKRKSFQSRLMGR